MQRQKVRIVTVRSSHERAPKFGLAQKEEVHEDKEGNEER